MAGTLLVSMFIMDLIAGSAYKVITGYSLSQRALEQSRSINSAFKAQSKIYHHDLAKNKSVDNAVWGTRKYRVRTNSLGFRDRSIRNVALIPDNYRIVFIGDSYTEGTGVDYDQTFVGLIDTALAKKGIEVMNAGAVSYSPIIYWRKIKYLIEDVGLKFNELVVFLDISDVQDEAVVYTLDKNENVELQKWDEYVPTGIYGRSVRFIKNQTILTFNILSGIHNLFSDSNKIQKKYAIDLHRSMWTVDERLYNEYGKRGMDRMGKYMSRLFSLLEKHNIKLTVAVYPWPDQIINGDLDSIHVSFWKDWCDKRNVRFINYFPYFINGQDRKENMEVLDQYFISSDYHWNEKGHKIIANVFTSSYNVETSEP